jgi:hypothetical protein
VIVLFAWLYVSAGILMTFGENLHGRIIFLREKIWAHKTSLTPPSFIEGTVISQESEWSCIIMLGVSILTFSMILIFDFGIGSTVWYFSQFIYILLLHK